MSPMPPLLQKCYGGVRNHDDIDYDGVYYMSQLLYILNTTRYIGEASEDMTEAEIAALPETVCRGGSNIIDPFGHPVTETLWDKEGVLYATLDMEKTYTAKMEMDCVGHYARPDVLHLEVNEK